MALRFTESFKNIVGDGYTDPTAAIFDKWDGYEKLEGPSQSWAYWDTDTWMTGDNYGMWPEFLTGDCNGYNPHWFRLDKIFENQPTWIQGFLFWQDNVGYQSWAGDIGNMRIACFMDGDVVQLTLGMIIVEWEDEYEQQRESGYIRVWRGVPETGTVLATSTFFWDDDEDMYRCYFIEWKATIHNSAGSVVVRITPRPSDYLEGEETQEIINISGVDTSASGNEYADTVSIWSGNEEPGDPLFSEIYVTYDDLYICDATGGEDDDFLGVCRVDCVFPDSEGSDTDFTPSTGENWENVDEVEPDGDATHNESASPWERDSYNLESLSLAGPTSAIRGIQVCGYMSKQDAGGLAARNTIRTYGSSFPGATVSPPYGEYDYSLDIFAFNPVTLARFGPGEIAALEAGVEHTLGVAPSASTVVVSSVGPTVLILGSASVSPSPVTVIASVVNPTVVLGSTSVSPSASTVVASSIDPTVVIG